MDGCTMAPDSYFASTLVGKLLRKITTEKNYRELSDPDLAALSLEDYLKLVCRELFKELVLIRDQLLLDEKELLTTLLLMLVDKKNKQGYLLVIGDGLANINGCCTEFDQNNKPDYLGFHLNEDFDTWYDSQKQKMRIDYISDVSIATDGITTFAKIDATANPIINAAEFLLIDQAGSDGQDMLEKKLKTLEHIYGLRPTDDLGIVRIIL